MEQQSEKQLHQVFQRKRRTQTEVRIQSTHFRSTEQQYVIFFEDDDLYQIFKMHSSS